MALWALAVGALALNRYLVGVFYDDGLYAGLAAAIAGGEGYVHPHLPGMPPAIHYPPVYPLFLAPAFGFLSREGAGLAGKLANLVCAAAAAGLIARHATRIRLLGERAPLWLPAAVVAAAAVAAPVLTTQSVLFAEPLFALLLAATVTLADRAALAPAPHRGLALAVGAAAALTLLTRTIGVAAGAAAVVFIAIPVVTRRAAIFAALPLGFAAVGWLAWTMTHRGGIDPALAINYGSYGEVLRQAGLGALGSSALDLPRPLLAISVSWLPGPLVLVFGVPAIAIGLYGLWVVVRRSSIGLTLAGYLAILAIWPFPPDRFLWAVLPWIALVWVAGVAALLRGWPRIPTLVIATAVLVGYATYQVRAMGNRVWASQAAAIAANWNELLPALRDLPERAVLASDNEALVWLYTDRLTVPLYTYGYSGATVTLPTTAEHRAYLERQGVTHVVLASASSPSAALLRALIGAYPGWLEPVHSWPGGRWIFAVRP